MSGSTVIKLELERLGSLASGDAPVSSDADVASASLETEATLANE